ncbi:MAG: hypothetical protein P1R58_10295 [bacterium]|nr:hypothetical protein [bacterium]
MTTIIYKTARFSAEISRSLLVLILFVGFISHASGLPSLLKNVGIENCLEEAAVIPLLESSEWVDGAPESMTPNGYPRENEQAFIACNVTSHDSNGSHQVIHSSTAFHQFDFSRKGGDFKSSLIISSSQVSSDLGRQFRLVGAKPSGTS